MICSDKEYLSHLLKLLASLEYNGHVLQNQQGTLDKMVDMVQVVSNICLAKMLRHSVSSPKKYILWQNHPKMDWK